MRSSIFKATILAVTAFGPNGTVASPIQDQSGDPNPQLVPPGSDGWEPFLLPPLLPPSIKPPSFTTKPTTSRLVTREQETPKAAAPSAAPFAREALATQYDVEFRFHIKEWICRVGGKPESGVLHHLPDPPYEMHPTPIHVSLTRGSLACWKTAVGSPPPQYFDVQEEPNFEVVMHKDGKGLRILAPGGCGGMFDEMWYFFSCSPGWLDVETWHLIDEEKASHIGAGDHGAIARLATREQDTRHIAAPLQRETAVVAAPFTGDTLLGQLKDSSWKPIEQRQRIEIQLILQDGALGPRRCTLSGRYKSGEFPDRSLYDGSGELNSIHVNLTDAIFRCEPMPDFFAPSPAQYFEFRKMFNLFAQVNNSGMHLVGDPGSTSGCYVPEGEFRCFFKGEVEWRVWRLGKDDRTHLEGVAKLLAWVIIAGSRSCKLVGDIQSEDLREGGNFYHLTDAGWECRKDGARQPAQYTDFRKDWRNGIDLFMQDDDWALRLVGHADDSKCYLPKGAFGCNFESLDVEMFWLNADERAHLDHVAKLRDEVRRDGLEHDIDWMA
ncbi:hypothetical protein QBC37DRAFT_375505 [Rhypophila decipiens]|uniref:Uncharacterized protein n=1 Tax=Rhypophila decipiens TaxID=261697 RepID=A0AAN6Y5W2_9PEZI|nr:hypothetical protein QBC37DRAFT_375505 [Rhypophila decipiens]